jgi:RNA polymerase sigma-70 factor (ECF subfamily)
MTIEKFKEEILPMKNKLYRFALRLLNSTIEAEDAVQEIFLKLWSKKEDIKNYRSVEAFAMTMTRNYCLDKLKAKHAKNLELDRAILNDTKDDPHKQMDIKDTIKTIHEIIEHLPEQQKIVIQMRDVENCDFDEIAEVTQLSLNNVRVILSRARKKVRNTLLKIQSYEFSSN